ncbi:unnamed protein product [Linum tenue]|uniref:MSP domain-containing protein n=1 Tax=Linum tenue TaxID=586396 RepID=A0AAV0K5U7_9ROSI|nr:unnamed protein product [Linum tenue]CAI0417780.1 unnamed protein product [Linum tenue]
MSTGGGGNQMITIIPDELKFVFEVEKQSFCDLKVVNNTENHVAFKVKTTSPKKYFVRPNTGVIQPWDSCVIRVTLQAQKECPPDMQCKDKFLLQSTTVPQLTDVDDLPSDLFTKESNGKVEECKLRVLYIPPSSTAQGNGEEDGLSSCRQSFDGNFVSSFLDQLLMLVRGRHGLLWSRIEEYRKLALQRLKEERDGVVNKTQQLQQELDLLKRRKYPEKGSGFSITFALVAGLIGIVLGVLIKLWFSSPSAVENTEILTEILTPPPEL